MSYDEPPRYLIFDLGGVLVDPDLPRLKRNLAALFERDVETIDREVFASGLKEAHDLGEFGPDGFHARVCRALGKAVSAARFAAAWCDLFTERDEAVALLPVLAERCRLFVGSNTDPLHAGYIRDVYRWTDAFDEAWLSFEARVAKPDPAFLKGALTSFGLPADATLFLDDRSENVASASLLGLRTIHVTDPHAVARGLAAVGLLGA